MYPHEAILYDSVLSLDNDVTLNPEEINFAFSVWQTFPHRIVGYPSRVRFMYLISIFNFLEFLNHFNIDIWTVFASHYILNFEIQYENSTF